MEMQLNMRPSAPVHAELTRMRKLLAVNPITVYHGTTEDHMVPRYGGGADDNDYGKGFYTTPYKNLGMEWAWSPYAKPCQNHFVYTYKCDLEGMKILNLLEYDIMYWISVLVQHRTLNSSISGTRLAFEDNLEELKKRYPVKTDDYDVIIGYRADDRYFGFAYDFLAGNIYKEQLEQALISGDLGAQVFIRSERAFERLTQTGVEKVSETYADKAEKRSRAASVRYNNEIRKNRPRSGTSIGMLLWGQSR